MKIALKSYPVRICALLVLLLFMSAPSFSQEESFPTESEISIPADITPDIFTGDNDPFENLVTLNLKDANITDIFRLIAEQNNLNIIVSPKVSGSISLRLSDVTLREAIDVILQSANARMEQSDNIIRILALNEKDNGLNDGRLVTKIVDCNYVDARQIVDVLKDLQSDQGKIKIFEGKSSSGTNFEKKKLIITDFPENLEAMLELRKRLDVETRQIMIDAKIIETTLTDSEILGTDWSVGASLDGPPFELDSKYAPGGSISYGTLSLSAFQAVYERVMATQNANVLSDAKVVVLDGERAHVHVGDIIPVSINTIASGVAGNTNFGRTSVQQWEVGVTLDVTPHLLEKKIIRMDINPDISSVSSEGSTGGDTAPTTNSRSVDTKILISSGETIVIGGLVQDMDNVAHKKIPVLGDLPLVGSMFRKKTTTTNKLNLIIFITGTLLDLKGEQKVITSESAAEAITAPNADSVNEFLEYK